MRRLMWFVIGFVAACAGCAYGYIGINFYYCAAFALLPTVFCFVVGIRWKPGWCAGLIFLGCTIGFAWFAGFRGVYLQPVISMDGTVQTTTVQITDYSYETDYGVAADAKITVEGKEYRTRVYINENEPLTPGDIAAGEFRFRLTTEDSLEGGTYHAGKGTFLLAYQMDDVEISHMEPDLKHFRALLAERIRSTIRECFPQDVYPFAIALFLGDDSCLDYQTETAFQVSGIRHVIAVSGLHISILYGLICVLTVRKRFLTAFVGIPLLILFAAVVGFSPSVTRACIMVALMMLAQCVNQEYDGPTALAFSVLVMLLVNPLVVTSAGFILSVSSVSGIFLFYKRIYGWLSVKMGAPKRKTVKARLLAWVKTSLAVTLSALALTTPFAVCYFGTVSLISVLTNLLTIWIISFLFYGMIAVCVLGMWWTAGGTALAWIVAWGMRYVIGVAELLSRLPIAAVYTSSVYITLWIIFTYVLFAVFLLIPKRKPMVFICCAIIGLCVSLLVSWLEPLSDFCRVNVLDVGQGQSILIQCEGKNYLIDCGGDSDEKAADTASKLLLSQGVRKLDALIVTHYDSDHAGGVPEFLTRIQTEVLFLPAIENDGISEEIVAASTGTTVYVREDLAISGESHTVTIFGPTISTDSNENSLCVLFSAKDYDILITGDRSGFGERMLLRHTALPQVDLLIAGHHGSGASTSEELLATVCPETVIISVGADNRYGHPEEALLERLKQYGCQVYRTDLQGTIIYRR